MQTELIFSQEAFPANHSASQEKEKVQVMSATYGEKCLEQLKKLNPNLSSQKMFLVSQILTADWYSSRCALIWKMKGTKFNRLLFQLQPKTHRTDVIGAGLLPTPTAMDKTSATANMKSSQVKPGSMHSMTLSRFLCTPTAQSAKGNTSDKRGKGNLTDQIAEMELTTSKTSQLNPRFVAEMMGFPPNWTELPFLSGEQKVSKPTETP